jgi:hypothetical protein
MNSGPLTSHCFSSFKNVFFAIKSVIPHAFSYLPRSMVFDELKNDDLFIFSH